MAVHIRVKNFEKTVKLGIVHVYFWFDDLINRFGTILGYDYSLCKCSGIEYLKKASTLAKCFTSLLPSRLRLASMIPFISSILSRRFFFFFFGVVANLTDLFLSVSGPDHTLDLWRSIAENKIPLTRFFFHQRLPIRYDDAEEGKDIMDLSLSDEEIEELEIAGEGHPFARLNLLCLGLFAFAPILVKQTHQ
jgi:hypothetical protein